MSMSLRENITAVIETCFSETKEEIQEVAIDKILELIRTDKADRKTEPQTAECPFDDAIPCEWVNCPNSTDCPYKPKDEPQTDCIWGAPNGEI